MKTIRVTRGGCGVIYTDRNGIKRHALKTPADKPFECDDAQAERLVKLGVAEYVNELWKKVADPEPETGNNGEGDESGAPAERLTAEALEKWDYNDLKALAADMGVNPEGKKKGDYINAILAAQDESETDEDDEDALPSLSAADPE